MPTLSGILANSIEPGRDWRSGPFPNLANRLALHSGQTNGLFPNLANQLALHSGQAINPLPGTAAAGPPGPLVQQGPPGYLNSTSATPDIPLPPPRPGIPPPPARPDGGNADLGGGYFMTPGGDVTAPGQKAMPSSAGVQSSPPATGNLPPGVIQYDVPGAGYRPGRGPLITAAQLGKWFGG